MHKDLPPHLPLTCTDEKKQSPYPWRCFGIALKPREQAARGQRCRLQALISHPELESLAVPGPLTFARDAVRGSPIKNHPLKERVVVDVLLRPRGRQAAALAALLFAEVGLVEDLAAAVPRLPEPAVPSCGGQGRTGPGQCRDQQPHGHRARLALTFAGLLALFVPFHNPQLARPSWVR